MKLKGRFGKLALLLLAISLAVASAWPKDALEAQTPAEKEGIYILDFAWGGGLRRPV